MNRSTSDWLADGFWWAVLLLILIDFFTSHKMDAGVFGLLIGSMLILRLVLIR